MKIDLQDAAQTALDNNVALNETGDSRFTLSGGKEELSLSFPNMQSSIAGSGLTKNLTLVLDVFNPQKTNEILFVRFTAKGAAKTMELDAVLFPNLNARAAFALSLLDGQLFFPPLAPGTLKRHVIGDGMRPEDVDAMQIGLRKGYAQNRSFVIRQAYFTDEAVEIPAADGVTVDILGQWKQKEWPGKTKSPAALRNRLQEEITEHSGMYPNSMNALGGAKDKQFEPSGFFRTEKRDGRWHLVDPGGHEFFSLGVFGVYPGEPGWIRGVENQFTWLPDPAGAYAPAYSKAKDLELFRRKFGGMFPDDTLLFSPAVANLIRAFGDRWYTQWASLTNARLHSWAVNTLSMFSDPAFITYSKIPYVIMLGGYPVTSKRVFREFPDVFSPEYTALCEAFGVQLARHAQDPMLIGYFLNNEPTWGFIQDLNLAEKLLETGEQTYSKDALIRFLRERYPTIQHLNDAWRLSLKSFEDLRAPLRNVSAYSASAAQDLRDFTGVMIDRYASLPAQYARQSAPNHLNLGMRFAAMNNKALLESSRHFDVFSFNCYQASPESVLNKLAETLDMPMLVEEFHFGALDAGLPSPSLFQVAGQQERGEAYARYVQSAASHPNAVGVHYFAYNDQPLWGRYDGENYQFGFVDICNMPYQPFVEQVKATNSAIYDIVHGRGKRLGGQTIRV